MYLFYSYLTFHKKSPSAPKTVFSTLDQKIKVSIIKKSYQATRTLIHLLEGRSRPFNSQMVKISHVYFYSLGFT